MSIRALTSLKDGFYNLGKFASADKKRFAVKEFTVCHALLTEEHILKMHLVHSLLCVGLKVRH